MKDNTVISFLKHKIYRAESMDELYVDCVNVKCLKAALDLISRQRTEIERLDQESEILEEELENRNKDIYDLISKERSNAILEFVEALKQETDDDFVFMDIIDSLAKEITEVEE